jgi:hypothetical protein
MFRNFPQVVADRLITRLSLHQCERSVIISPLACTQKETAGWILRLYRL